uniref:Uncharacterized protein n=1 Tax=Anguilla anguilla TaxID=7936 RepID=A0A0E9S997_ANGAN
MDFGEIWRDLRMSSLLYIETARCNELKISRGALYLITVWSAMYKLALQSYGTRSNLSQHVGM